MVLVGDSTVTDGAGWGSGFKQLLNDKAECFNTAAGGRSSKSFINEGRWEKALALKGNYYLIQFGHNDEPGKGADRETEPRTTYRQFMARYVDEARAAGSKPVLVTSLTRRQWDKTGKIKSSLVPYAEAVRELAKEKHVPVVDLHERSIAVCERLGREKCNELSPIKETNQVDNTHLNAKGSVVFARLVAEELVQVVPELRDCFRPEALSGAEADLKNDAGAAQGLDINVRDLGAKGDGVSLDTDAIQKALNRCGESGGGTVRLPSGVYLSKPLTLGAQTTLLLENGARLQATDEPSDFSGASGSFIPFISGKGLTNVAIVGPGVIDGAGAKWWVPAEAARRKTPGYTLPRPNLIVLTGCRNVRVQDVTLQNSPKFHLVPAECENVLVTNVTVTAPPRSPNTDAIDPSSCRGVLITHCRIDVGDDNVAIKAGKKVAGREFACEDIHVTGCTFLHGHGMSIGSETVGGVRNVLVENCTFENTENGLRIKSQRGRGGIVENIMYRNITMKNVDPALTFTCKYMNNSKGDPNQPTNAQPTAVSGGSERLPVYRKILVQNLEATCPDNAGTIIGLTDSPIQDIVLERVRINAIKGLTVTDAAGIRFKDSELTIRDGPSVITTRAQVEGAQIQK